MEKKKIETDEEYERANKLLDSLVDAKVGTEDYQKLIELADLIHEYEKKNDVFGNLEEIIICNKCRGKFSTKKPNYTNEKCKCGAIMVDTTPHYAKVSILIEPQHELPAYKRIVFDYSKIEKVNPIQCEKCNDILYSEMVNDLEHWESVPCSCGGMFMCKSYSNDKLGIREYKVTGSFKRKKGEEPPKSLFL